MKKIAQLLGCMLIAAGTSSSMAQSTENKAPVWDEFAQFYSRFAACYHPADLGDMSGLRANGDSLVISGLALKNSVPAQFNTPEIVQGVEGLHIQATSIVSSMKSGVGDADLKKLLNDLNSSLQQVSAICRAKAGL